MIYGMNSRRSLTEAAINQSSARVRNLAEIGAKGHQLTPVQVREICEAYRSQARMLRKNFENGYSG